MSHFYGILSGQSQTETTRRGSKNSGVICTLASWQQGIILFLYRDPDTDQDMYKLSFCPWQGQGQSKLIASGRLVQ